MTAGVRGTMVEESVSDDSQPNLERHNSIYERAKMQMYCTYCSMLVAYNTFIKVLELIKETLESIPSRKAS
jgi:hypothetical protein